MNYPDFLDRIFSSALSRFNWSVIARVRLSPILVALMLGLFPMKAFSQCNVSGDIPFLADNNLPVEACIICSGPWGRTSALRKVDAGVQNCQFYAADKGIFPPFGGWECQLFNIDPNNGFCDEEDFIDFVDFCVKDTTSVILTFIPNPPQLNVNKPDPPCSSSVSSFLGDNFKQEKSKPDSDEFLFDGAGGDQVTLRLETNPQEGNNGGEASLGISGSSLNESTTGTPPLELDVALPEDGKYSIMVEQPKNSAQTFRGSYDLDVESSTGVDLIEPTNSVEK